jgi:hypothetical protein
MSHTRTDDTREQPPAPGTVSDQNGEEAEPGMDDGSGDGERRRDADGREKQRERDDDTDDGVKRTQATGHPGNAG